MSNWKVEKVIYVLMRKDEMNDYETYDQDYPVESAFLTREEAEEYAESLIKYENLEEVEQDELFEILQVPLQTIREI